jgi:hypothetical protein
LGVAAIFINNGMFAVHYSGKWLQFLESDLWSVADSENKSVARCWKGTKTSSPRIMHVHGRLSIRSSSLFQFEQTADKPLQMLSLTM